MSRKKFICKFYYKNYYSFLTYIFALKNFAFLQRKNKIKSRRVGEKYYI